MTATRQAWSEGAVGSLHGRTAVVTGAYSGVGLATAQLPAEHGLHVVLACRDKGKGSKPPGTQLTPPQATRSGARPLDLADLVTSRSLGCFCRRCSRERADRW